MVAVARVILRSVGGFVVTLIAASVIVFAATTILPGSVANAILGQQATPEMVKAIEHRLHLDEPAPQRYARWLAGMAHGDFGTSLTANQPVADLVWPRFRNTAALAAAAFLAAVPLSIALGIMGGLKAGSWIDQVISGITLAMLSIPEFVVGTVLVFAFAITIPLLPAITLVDRNLVPVSFASALILPTLALTFSLLAHTGRLVRTIVQETQASDYMRFATLKGLTTGRLIFRHLLPNVLPPVLSVVALNVGWLLSGVVVVEAVFNYPGVGTLIVSAVNDRDVPVVQAIALLLGAIYILANTLADLISRAINPVLRGS